MARTSLRTKLYQDLADQLTDIVVDAVLTIRKDDEPLDLYMVTNMHPHSLPLHASKLTYHVSVAMKKVYIKQTLLLLCHECICRYDICS